MLSDTKAKQAKPKSKAYKLADAGGLYLFVSPTGAKSWRYDYRLAGRRETLTIGRYIDAGDSRIVVSLAEAREMHAEARRQVARGESPSLTRKRERQAAVLGAANTFKAIGDAWYAETAPHRSSIWQEGTKRWLEKRLYPAFGSVPIDDVSPADILAVIKKVAQGGHARSAEYIRQTAARVFEYAIRNLRARQNPAREVRGALTLPEPKKRRPLPAKEIPTFLTKLDAYPGRLQSRLAW